MPRYLITQSLLSAWLYVFSCWEDGKDEAMQSFMDTLNRIPSEQNEAMKAGSDFEALVYRIADGEFKPKEVQLDMVNPVSGESFESKEYPKGFDGAAKVAEYVRGGQYQVRLQRELEACGMSFLVYGVLDALKSGEIFDIKYKTKSFGSLDLVGSYLDSPQHSAYFYLVPEAYRFTYLVSDGNDLYTEIYTPEMTRPIADIITEFISFLRDMNLLEVYKAKWESK
jgi:hypothetical protein